MRDWLNECHGVIPYTVEHEMGIFCGCYINFTTIIKINSRWVQFGASSFVIFVFTGKEGEHRSFTALSGPSQYMHSDYSHIVTLRCDLVDNNMTLFSAPNSVYEREILLLTITIRTKGTACRMQTFGHWCDVVMLMNTLRILRNWEKKLRILPHRITHSIGSRSGAELRHSTWPNSDRNSNL